MYRAVLFDVAGVLTEGFSHAIVEGAVAAGADLGVLAEALLPIFAGEGDGDSMGNRLERGEVNLEEFLASLGGAERDARMVLDPASEHFFGARLAPLALMHDFVAEVRGAGFLVAAVSNNVREWQPWWDAAMPPHHAFDTVVFSAEVGMRKPGPAIYAEALRRLDVEPAAAIFLDDFAAMAQGARDAGMTAIDVVGHASAIAEARSLLGLPAAAPDAGAEGDPDRAAAGGAGQA